MKRIILLAALTVAASAASVPAAQARVACGPSAKVSCFEMDPRASGCDVGAETRRKAVIVEGQPRRPVATVELRYSPRCRSVWARVTAPRPRWMQAWTEHLGGSRRVGGRPFAKKAWSVMYDATAGHCYAATGHVFATPDGRGDVSARTARFCPYST